MRAVAAQVSRSDRSVPIALLISVEQLQTDAGIEQPFQGVRVRLTSVMRDIDDSFDSSYSPILSRAAEESMLH